MMMMMPMTMMTMIGRMVGWEQNEGTKMKQWVLELLQEEAVHVFLSYLHVDREKEKEEPMCLSCSADDRT